MGPDPRHLEWGNLQAMLRSGAPAVQPIAGIPWAHIFVDEGGSRLGLRSPLTPDPELVASPLLAISIRRVKWEGAPALEVATDRPTLFKEFYDLLRALADRIQLDGIAPAEALAITISHWHDLLRPTQLMSPEQQLGLAGELWTLVRLLRVFGQGAFTAWTGPLDEPHDFRLGNVEVEVKSTRRHRRVHEITSLDQLQATAGRRLYLLSLQMEAAGHDAGWTLPDVVDQVRDLLGVATLQRATFEEALRVTWRYANEHASEYGARIEFRQPPMLVEVQSDSPRITRSMLVAALGKGSARIPAVRYDLDVEGVGVLDGSMEFLSVLPEVAPHA